MEKAGFLNSYFIKEVVHSLLGLLVAMVGVWANAEQKLYFVHSDHLGTPRILTDENQTVVWQAEYTPFGEATIDEDPDGDGMAVEFNLRFPGQYYDKETDTNYNYYRTYDPKLGRYIQSDPIGLEGGVNTYIYVGDNPLVYTDPLGLAYSPMGEHGMTRYEVGIGSEQLEDKCGCFEEVFLGIEEAVVVGAAIATTPYRTPAKSGGVAGGGPSGQYSNLISRAAHEINKKNNLKKTPLTNAMRGAGRLGSRWVPVAGWGLLFFDFFAYDNCVRECNECLKPE